MKQELPNNQGLLQLFILYTQWQRQMVSDSLNNLWNRELNKKITMETEISLNKSFNEENNGRICAL